MSSTLPRSVPQFSNSCSAPAPRAARRSPASSEPAPRPRRHPFIRHQQAACRGFPWRTRCVHGARAAGRALPAINASASSATPAHRGLLRPRVWLRRTLSARSMSGGRCVMCALPDWRCWSASPCPELRSSPCSPIRPSLPLTLLRARGVGRPTGCTRGVFAGHCPHTCDTGGLRGRVMAADFRSSGAFGPQLGYLESGAVGSSGRRR